MLGDIPLAIMVNPNGVDDERKGHVGVYVENKGDGNSASVRSSQM